MNTKILVVLAILVATSRIEAAPGYNDVFLSENTIECRINEIYTRSAAACQPDCGNPEPLLCIRIGMAGCVCEEGYIRNSNWNCIKKEDCVYEL